MSQASQQQQQEQEEDVVVPDKIMPKLHVSYLLISAEEKKELDDLEGGISKGLLIVVL